MTDDIDNQPAAAARRSGTYHFCPRCGMMLTGVTCGFCAKLGEREEPKRKTWWVGAKQG